MLRNFVFFSICYYLCKNYNMVRKSVIKIKGQKISKSIGEMIEKSGGDITQLDTLESIEINNPNVCEIVRQDFTSVVCNLATYLQYKKCSDSFIGKVFCLIPNIGKRNLFNAITFKGKYATFSQIGELLHCGSTTLSTFMKELDRLGILIGCYHTSLRRNIYCFNPYIIGRGKNYYTNIKNSFIDLALEGNWDLHK